VLIKLQSSHRGIETGKFLIRTVCFKFAELFTNFAKWFIDIERRKIDCLMTRTACLVCFIITVNNSNKKKRKEDYYEGR
jgi:hypothetical protein